MKKLGGNIIKSGLFMLLLFCLTLPALPAAAGSGIAIGPARIEITDAMRGAEYRNGLIIFNTGNRETDFTVTADGEAAPWLSFSYQGGPFERITVPSGGRGAFEVTAAVPGDAANGVYSARVMVTSAPSGSSGVGALVAAFSTITMTVSGTQVLSGEVTGLSIDDQETGFPVMMQVFFNNTGNVAVSPSIDVTIDWAGNTVDSFNYSDTEVGPSQKATIDVNWDTTGQALGDYDAKVSVSLDGEEIYTNNISFKILALGSLTRSGELREVSVEGTPRAGRLLKIEGVFANTGGADVLAKLTGEIYYDGSLVEVLESDGVLVNRGQLATLAAYFTPEQNGMYTVKAQADFGGIKSNTVQLTLTVPGAPDSTGTVAEATPPAIPGGNTDGGLAAYLYIVIGLAGATAVTGGYLFIWRRKQFVPVFVGSYNKVFKDLARNKLFKRFKLNIKRAKHTGKK